MTNEFDQAAATWDANPYRTERARAVAQGIFNTVPFTPQMTALEYGCGTGLLSFALQALVAQPNLGQIILADNSAGMLAEVDKKIAAGGLDHMSALEMDLSGSQLPELKVQLIYTLMTLHHIPDTRRILSRFYDLLDAPGYLCVADLDTEDGSFHGPDFTGHKGFDHGELGKLACEIGFQQVRFSTIFQTPRMVGSSIQYFPVFLMTALKGT